MSNEPQPIDIVKSEEPWGTAYLADGTKVRVKLVFDRAFRVLDAQGRPAFAEDGQPSINISFKWVVSVDAPASMRRQGH